MLFIYLFVLSLNVSFFFFYIIVYILKPQEIRLQRFFNVLL